MKPIAYEGQEPYIFISYAHRDSDRVFQVLDALNDKGYRVWYDDGIAPGSEWPEDIAQHLDAAAMVIAFVTPASMASRNCRREINFALSKEKPFLSVFLERTEMPLGMEMQLSAQQSILRYNFTNEADFIQKILRCPEIEPCRIPEPAPEEVPAETVTTAAVPVLQDLPVDDRPEEKQQGAKPEKNIRFPKKEKPHKTPAAQSPAQKPDTGSGKKTGKRFPFIPILLGFAVLIAAVAVGLSMGKVNTSWGRTYDAKTSDIIITNEVFTQADLEGITGLKNLRSLTISNSDLSACDFSRIKFASKDFIDLELSGNTEIRDFGFLSGLTLRYLTLDGCSAFSDLSLVDLSSMVGLSLDGTGVTDLSPLAGTEISRLSFKNTAVSDLSFAREMPDLTEISGAGSGVTSLLPLADLEDLTKIDFQDCGLKELPEEMAALKLSDVNLAGCGLTDAGLLRNCTILKNLDLRRNPEFKDPGDLFSRNYKTLTKLNISDTGLDEKALETLYDCTELTSLSLSGIQTEGLRFVSRMKKLTVLRAENCGINSTDALRHLENLEYLLLSFNQISSVSDIGYCVKPEERQILIDLSFNPLQSVSELPPGHYRALLLHGTDQQIAKTLKDGVKAYTISLPWGDGILSSTLKNKGYYGEILLVDCPATQKLNAQDTFGSAYCKFVSEQELMDMLHKNDLSYSLNANYDYPYEVYQSR